ncbi:MAG: hypothetical protein M3M99_06405 [Actinomycetota bacterium]|nr:hypothetical protein [Actinomycetota bacterium]
MTPEQVAAIFGPPQRQRTFPGCELDPKAPDSISAKYRLDDGVLYLIYNEPTRELESYRTTSPSLQTADADRVGDPFSSLQQRHGDELRPLPLGQPPTEQEGFWSISDGPRSQLLFDIRKGAIAGISGGYLRPCE